MTIVNTDYISGKKLETIGIVNGWEMAGFKLNLEKIAKVVNEKMIANAREMHADAIVNVRYIFSGDGRCVLATGTAVKFV